jgi:hypothetical protein
MVGMNNMNFNEYLVQNEEESSDNINTEENALRMFQTSVASALLTFSDCKLDTLAERRLASALLFLSHLSSEITRGFANGDEEVAMGLLTDAIIESRRAYKSGIFETDKIIH